MLTRERELLRGFCMGILLTAVLFRLAAAVPWRGLRTAEGSPVTEVPTAQADYPTLLYETEADIPAEVDVDNTCGAVFDQAALLAQPLTLTAADGPVVLIVHTHATEAYTLTEGETYTASAAYRTEDTAHNVVRVGQALCDRLNANGIWTLHDTSLNDLAGYDGSYERMEETIGSYLREYPTLQMVIDVHRDAVEDAAGKAVALSAQSGGESCARLMLVVGTDQGGLEHPNWQENLANALKLQSVLEGSYPGLCRSLDLRTERFNQHATPGSFLVEVGSNGNTLEQALRSAQILGNALAQMLLLLQQNGGTLTESGSLVRQSS